ncbi:Hypothetical protein FKW44_019790 [Caligus rogercresseyi]|uniref:Uncharacterized protein n=1 Tax=Caligus rogercresseyi TaxID=217165 RepID=A0A7T8GWY5_CALRO|nr:Hypothetical protein FKW44_019790 [Caligus rogercresseyi]
MSLPQQTNEGVLFTLRVSSVKAHNLENNGYSPDEPSIFVSFETGILKEDSLLASPPSLANM